MDELNSGEVVESSAENSTGEAVDTPKSPFNWSSWQSAVKPSDDNSKTVEEEVEESLGDTEESEEDDDESEIEDEAEKADSEKKDEAEKSEEETDKKSRRSMNYKELQKLSGELQEQLKTKDASYVELEEKLSKLDTALESYGGVEQITKFIDKVDRFINPGRYKEVADYVQTLPHGDVIVSEILNRSFDLDTNDDVSDTAIANRLTVLNKSLVQDFGLKEGFTPAEAEQIFTWLATYSNFSKEEMLEAINENLETLDNGESKEVRKLKAEKAELEAKLKEKAEPAAKILDTKQVIAKFDKIESDTVNLVVEDILKARSATLDPEITELLQAKIRYSVSTSKVAFPIYDYLSKGKETHEDLAYFLMQYKNAVKTVINPLISKLLGGNKAEVSETKPKKEPLTTNGKNSIAPINKTSEKFDWSQYG
jgi:hypothetical protein